jgi:sec-independent protein translocase protein TatB
MFDFSFWELVVIGVIALIVVGPNRLPGLARQVGTWIGKAKSFVNSVRTDIERELQSEELKRMLTEQQNEIDELKGMISNTQAEVRSEILRHDDLADDQPSPDVPQSQTEDQQANPVVGVPSHPNRITSDNDAKRSAGS